MAAHMTSERGNDCLLTDIVQDAVRSSRVIQPVKQPG
jgi:hypothetical protein